MIDLHTHSSFSDGELIPSELVRRAVVLGYTAIAITDHVDYTNIEHILSSVCHVKSLENDYDIRIFSGIEIHPCSSFKNAPACQDGKKTGSRCHCCSR